LKADFYPLWKSDAVNVTSAGERLEYKYVKFTNGGGQEWEQGANRWVPVEDTSRAGAVTIHDTSFGMIQPQPFSFEDNDDRPKLREARPGEKRIAVIGSSVAEGFNSWRKRGWAWLLAHELRHRYGHDVVNLSQCGASTEVTLARFRETIAPWCPDIVIIALSLGNEGLFDCPGNERRARQHRFEKGLLDLVSLAVSMGVTPMLGGVYPNGRACQETYHITKETRRTMSTWGIPVFDWFDAVDDGHGRWKPGIYFDHAHPNLLGHKLMFDCIDKAWFDFNLQQGPAIDPLLRRRSSFFKGMDVGDDKSQRMVRKTSQDLASEADPQLAARLRGQAGANGMPEPYKVAFRDSQGFSVAVDTAGNVLSFRNKTSHEYGVNETWGALNDALVRNGMKPGIFTAGDLPGCQKPALDSSVLRVNPHGKIEGEVKIPPRGDVVFKRNFQQLSPRAPGAQNQWEGGDR